MIVPVPEAPDAPGEDAPEASVPVGPVPDVAPLLPGVVGGDVVVSLGGLTPESIPGVLEGLEGVEVLGVPDVPDISVPADPIPELPLPDVVLLGVPVPVSPAEPDAPLDGVLVVVVVTVLESLLAGDEADGAAPRCEGSLEVVVVVVVCENAAVPISDRKMAIGNFFFMLAPSNKLTAD